MHVLAALAAHEPIRVSRLALMALHARRPTLHSYVDQATDELVLATQPRVEPDWRVIFRGGGE